MSRNRGLFNRPEFRTIPREDIPGKEREEARRSVRDWLRDRDETNTDEFEVEDELDAI